jgi:hypothetical protein
MENENLILLDSTVSLEADLQDITNATMPLQMECNYNISNTGVTTNTILVMPISYDLLHQQDLSYSVLVNGSVVELEILEYPEINYLDNNLILPVYEYFFFNATLGSNSITHVKFSTEFTFNESTGRTARTLWIFYQVSAVNIWDSYESVSVEFDIKGIQPSEYLNFTSSLPEKICSVSNYESGTIYYWYWETANITESIADVQWELPREKPFTFLVNWDVYSLMLLTISTILVAVYYRTRRKMKGCSHERN